MTSKQYTDTAFQSKCAQSKLRSEFGNHVDDCECCGVPIEGFVNDYHQNSPRVKSQSMDTNFLKNKRRSQGRVYYPENQADIIDLDRNYGLKELDNKIRKFQDENTALVRKHLDDNRYHKHEVALGSNDRNSRNYDTLHKRDPFNIRSSLITRPDNLCQNYLDYSKSCSPSKHNDHLTHASNYAGAKLSSGYGDYQQYYEKLDREGPMKTHPNFYSSQVGSGDISTLKKDILGDRFSQSLTSPFGRSGQDFTRSRGNSPDDKHYYSN